MFFPLLSLLYLCLLLGHRAQRDEDVVTAATALWKVADGNGDGTLTKAEAEALGGGGGGGGAGVPSFAAVYLHGVTHGEL